MLCHHKSLLLHLGHFDGGKTILSFERVLRITTLKKLPKQSPKIQTQIIYNIVSQPSQTSAVLSAIILYKRLNAFLVF